MIFTATFCFSDKVLYLSKQEIDGMVAEFLSKQPSNDDYYGYWRPSSRADSGQTFYLPHNNKLYM